jgi:hypothetical protein
LVSWQRICVSFLGAQETSMPLNFSEWDFQGLDSELKGSDCNGRDGSVWSVTEKTKEQEREEKK